MSRAPNLSVAVAQTTSIDDIQANLLQMDLLLQRAQIEAPSTVRLICFPENCLYMRVKEGDVLPGLEISDPAFAHLAQRAQQLQMNIHLGSVPLRVAQKVYNHSVLITEKGEIKPSYQKIHLFDIHLEGQKPIRESDAFARGQSPSFFEIDGWKFGESICYDLRFAELFSQYARAEVDVILIPAAFLVKTGEAHWDVLMRARAIESQAYVLASAQGGEHNGKNGGQRLTYGNSLVVDPWGTVVGRELSSPGLLFAELSLEKIAHVRRQIPMKQHRRL